MAKLTKPREKIDQPALTGRLVVDTFRGTLRVRRWPRKRPGPKSIPLQNQIDWFRDMTQLLKRASASQMATAMQASANSGLYPRDLLMRAASRGFVDLELADGQILRQRSPQLEPVMYQGTSVRRTSPFAVTAGVVTAIPWQIAYIDTSAMWSLAAPTRLTIPAHVNIVRLSANVVTNTAASASVRINISDKTGAIVAYSQAPAIGRPGLPAITGPIAVAAGDWFETFVTLSSSLSLWEIAATHFTADILQAGT